MIKKININIILFVFAILFFFRKNQKKKLDTLKKRKRVINDLFKKDEKTGQILLSSEAEIIYEKPNEKLRSDLKFFSVCQIESVDEDYSDIYVKQVIFGPPHSKFAEGSTIPGSSERYESNRINHITYNKQLDIFNVTVCLGDNTFNSLGQFNNSKKFVIDIWENEDPRSLTNAFVGQARYINTTSDNLPKDILQIVTQNTFEEIDRKVWENNHKVVTPESIIIEGEYKEMKSDKLSINNEGIPIYTSENVENSQKIIKIKKIENTNYFTTEKEKKQTIPETGESGGIKEKDIELGILIKTNDVIEANLVETEKDNGITRYYNIEYDKNRIVQSFESLYKETGSNRIGDNSIQWPVIIKSTFKRI